MFNHIAFRQVTNMSYFEEMSKQGVLKWQYTSVLDLTEWLKPALRVFDADSIRNDDGLL